jgi:replicative DNA helicase
MTDMSLSDTVISHQKAAEWMFAGAIFIDSEYVREHCGWLDPEMILHPGIKQYWGDVKAGKDPAEAAVDAQIYIEVIQNMNRIASYYDAPAFAGAISDDRYLIASAEVLSKMAIAISERNTDKLKDFARGIVERAPLSAGQIPTAAEIGLDFQLALDDVSQVMLPTGIPPLDHKMGGVEKQSLIVIGGRPGMGKTIAGMQFAVTAARKGLRVIYFSLEMSRKALFQRLACGRAEVDWRLIKSRTATPEQIEKVKIAARELIDELDNRLLIDDSPMLTNEEIYRKVAQYRPDEIVVDHLLLVNEHLRGKMNEVVRVGQISRMGKVIAKQFDIPAIYLMQLNRDTEKRENKRPQLSDLRASGDVEQDADIVMFLYRPDYYQEEESHEDIVKAEIWLEKVRDGKAHVRADTLLNLKKQWFYAVQPEGETEEKPRQRRQHRQSTQVLEPDWDSNEDLEL